MTASKRSARQDLTLGGSLSASSGETPPNDRFKMPTVLASASSTTSGKIFNTESRGGPGLPKDRPLGENLVAHLRVARKALPREKKTEKNTARAPRKLVGRGPVLCYNLHLRFTPTRTCSGLRDVLAPRIRVPVSSPERDTHAAATIAKRARESSTGTSRARDATRLAPSSLENVHYPENQSGSYGSVLSPYPPNARRHDLLRPAPASLARASRRCR